MNIFVLDGNTLLELVWVFVAGFAAGVLAQRLANKKSRRTTDGSR